jgi:Putative MetA-pathway of phenol degradation
MMKPHRLNSMLPRASLTTVLFIAVAISAAAQEGDGNSLASEPRGATSPEANPGRPTVSTPATLTPLGYVQFETGVLSAWQSPGLCAQSNVNEVVKFSPTHRLQLLASSEPFAHSRARSQLANGVGDLDLGLQAVVYHGEGLRPTIALSYFGRAYSGDAPDLDIGSFRNSALLLVSADVRGFHYDTNYLFNEVIDGSIRRAQFGQTLSVSHALANKWGISGELWHFTQPFLRGNAVGSLWALNYNARPNLVLDGGFNRGLTSTSTRWEAFVGFTYLLPHRVGRR